jgi:hypothetical protein
MEMQTDPRSHATEAGFVEVRRTKYYAITDPRGPYFANMLTAAGAAWSPEHSAYIMPTDLKPEFEDACERIAAMPWLPLDKNLARYCDDELYKMGIRSVRQRTFADNPNSTMTRVYVAPNDELHAKATELIFERSRITEEQMSRIGTFIATGAATPTILEATPQEFNARVAAREVSQVDAKRILRQLEPPNEQALDDLRKLIQNGQLTEAKLGFDPATQPERLTSLKAQEAYDLINTGQRMAPHGLKQQVAALHRLGALGEEEIDLDGLTATKAKSLLGTGKLFVAEGEFERSLDDVKRDGFALAGQRGAYGQRLSSPGTDQGAYEQSQEKMTSLIHNGDVAGLNASASPVDFPPIGYVAGEVAWASGYHALLVVDANRYMALDRDKVGLESGLDLRDHQGEYVAFACRRGSKPYGMLTAAHSVGQAICEADARQTVEGQHRAYTAAAMPEQPVAGKVIAMRGDYVSLETQNGVLTVAKAQLSNSAPKYAETVTFEPEGQALSAAPAAARGRGGAARGSR